MLVMLNKVFVEESKMLNETNTQYGHPDFYKLLDQMAELHSKKNHDYAGTSDPLKNLRACTRLELDPFIGVMVRLQDKWSRIEEFVKSKTLLVKNESVEDTLMDNAVYSLLAIILLREQKSADGLTDDYNAVEIDGPKPKFKAGDEVCVNLHHDTPSSIKKACKDTSNKGVYIEDAGVVHAIKIGTEEFWFRSEEITIVEGDK